MEGKKSIAGHVQVNKTPEEIDFHYDTTEYDSYTKEGFNPPPSNERDDKHEREFLKRVDLSQDKIKIHIIAMVRQKVVDVTSEKKREKNI